MPDIGDKQRAQREAPLYAAVKAHLRQKNRSLHVPLHGGGAGAPDLQRSGFSAVLRWDLTEIDALDDLHLPRGAIGRAQELAAALFGAASTFFLVNGVTGGLLALFAAFCRPGEKVLLTRLAHKAALHGIALSGARPVYLPVERDRCSGLPLNVSAKMAERALQEHPEARLLLVTSPSYWGVTADLAAIRRVAARHGVILAVDEAHGTQFPFYRQKLPCSAAAGADVWLQSAHKSLGSLTPGAFLHLGPGALPFAPALRFWLQALQTSSPPYPLLVSLDLVRRQAALKGKTLFSAAWDWAKNLRRELAAGGFRLLTTGRSKEFQLDPCRVTVLCPPGEGQALARELAQKYRWQAEMSGSNYLLAIVGPAHLSFAPRKLVRALQGARAGCRNSGFGRPAGAAGGLAPAGASPDLDVFGSDPLPDISPPSNARSFSAPAPASLFMPVPVSVPVPASLPAGVCPALNIYDGDFPPSFFRPSGAVLPTACPAQVTEKAFPAFPLTPGEALRRPGISIPLQEAAGKICAEMLVPSPPGIPFLAPGERIQGAVLYHILKKRAEGVLFQGAADPALRTIKVVREEAGMVE